MRRCLFGWPAFNIELVWGWGTKMGALTGKALELARSKARADVRSLRERCARLDEDAIGVILGEARSHYAWRDEAISDDVLQRIYEVAASGPTSMNSCPARFVFVSSADGKERLARSLKPANLEKMRAAPVTAIVAHDLEFWRKLPFLFPHEDRRHHFDGKPEHAGITAFRNGTLQGAYLMIAARAMGLDVGPMSGFSNEIVDQEFFADTSFRSNFLCSLGYADESALFQKLPRFPYEEVCSHA